MFINSIFSALSGMRTSATKLQTSANNLANLQTPGFKKSRTEISDVSSGGAQVSAVTRLSTPGSPIPTTNPLGLAVNGEGYFQVSLADGGTGFTRAGSFKIDNTGQITTSSGNPLSPPVSVPGNATGVSIDSSGQVSAIVGGSSVTVGQIELAQFNNPGGLTAEGGNLFSASSGPSVSGTPGSGSRGTVISGALESSNVDIAEEIVGQIVSKAAFKANASVIRAADELIGSLLDIKS
ncbi:MAG: flagellar hook-basal body complex protein [Nitrospinae bacterium]|jgi:flagellar basal-body rod protein FlgG|nr:flagellar hook-basal body complex protein [Nitrospinota bacterium]MDA1109877.1 flagellar hook-basal body complex protein [Nitrospinota bacterium]